MWGWLFVGPQRRNRSYLSEKFSLTWLGQVLGARVAWAKKFRTWLTKFLNPSLKLET